MPGNRSELLHYIMQSVFAALTLLLAYLTYNNNEAIVKLGNIDMALVRQDSIMLMHLDSLSKQIKIMDGQLLSFQTIAEGMKKVSEESIKQTKELSTQTKEISTQTEIFNKNLEIQKDATAPVRSPRFEYYGHTYNDSIAGLGNCAIKIINKGSNALNIVQGEIINKHGAPDINWFNRDCASDSVFSFTILILNKDEQDSPNFDFYINYESVYGKFFKQRIFYGEGDGKITIGPPIEFQKNSK